MIIKILKRLLNLDLEKYKQVEEKKKPPERWNDIPKIIKNNFIKLTFF